MVEEKPNKNAAPPSSRSGSLGVPCPGAKTKLSMRTTAIYQPITRPYLLSVLLLYYYYASLDHWLKWYDVIYRWLLAERWCWRKISSKAGFELKRTVYANNLFGNQPSVSFGKRLTALFEKTKILRGFFSTLLSRYYVWRRWRNAFWRKSIVENKILRVRDNQWRCCCVKKRPILYFTFTKYVSTYFYHLLFYLFYYLLCL